MDVGRIRPVARAYLISVLVWCGLSVLTGWQYRIFDKALNIHSSLLDMLRLAEARGFTFALLTPPIFYAVRHKVVSLRRPIRYVVYVLGVVPFMFLYAAIHWVLLPPWDAVLQRYVPRVGHSPLEIIQNRFADQITIYIAILVAAHAYQYFERVRKEELARYELQQALAASELNALKMQLHPHFLFNTLHGISALIDRDPRTAKAMIVKLSDLLRTALEHGSSDLIPLSEEMKFVENYLELERMRFGPRLTVHLSIDPATREMLVPQLVLQPLVENAIRHGIACSREGGWIEIASQQNNGTFELRVRNSLGGKRRTGTGVGLRNTESRLKHLYAGEAQFSFTVEGRDAATASIVLPVLGSNLQQLARFSLPLGVTDEERGHASANR
jgi:sensor histidine kinase YesM